MVTQLLNYMISKNKNVYQEFFLIDFSEFAYSKTTNLCFIDFDFYCVQIYNIFDDKSCHYLVIVFTSVIF